MVDLSPFESYIAAFRSKATAERYSIAVQAFLSWLKGAYGEVPLGGLGRDAVSEYTRYLLDAGYLPGTIHSHLAGLNRYFRWLQEKHDVRLPDFHRVELPKPKRKVRDVLDSGMLTHYFRVSGELDEPLRTAVMLLPCSGLRSHEMVGLSITAVKRSQIKLKDGTDKSVLCFTVSGKGGNQRVVPLFDEGAEVLLGYLKGWRGKHRDALYLFPGRRSGHLSTRALRDSIQQIRGAFKASWTPHTMRRTYLTTLYRRGVPIPTLAKIGGHTTQVLIDYYLAVDDHDVMQAVHADGGRLQEKRP